MLNILPRCAALQGGKYKISGRRKDAGSPAANHTHRDATRKLMGRLPVTCEQGQDLSSGYKEILPIAISKVFRYDKAKGVIMWMKKK